MVQSMRDLERTWNSKFNYPWTFFNDVPFTEDFKRKTRAATKAECRYGMQWQGLRRRTVWLTWSPRNHPQRALGGALVDQRRYIQGIG